MGALEMQGPSSFEPMESVQCQSGWMIMSSSEFLENTWKITIANEVDGQQNLRKRKEDGSGIKEAQCLTAIIVNLMKTCHPSCETSLVNQIDWKLIWITHTVWLTLTHWLRNWAFHGNTQCLEVQSKDWKKTRLQSWTFIFKNQRPEKDRSLVLPNYPFKYS